MIRRIFLLLLFLLASETVAQTPPTFDGRSVDAWEVLLGDDTPAVWKKARADLVAGGEAALPVIRALVAREDPDAFHWYLGILAEVRPEEAVPAYARLLTAEDRFAAESAAKALGEIGEPAARAADALVATFSGKRYALAMDARDALRRIGPKAIPALRRGLRSPVAQCREFSSEVLGELGPLAVNATRDLAPLLTDGDADVRQEAARALARIAPGTPGVVPVLLRWRFSSGRTVHVDADVAFREAGPGLVPGLVKALADPDAEIRPRAADRLRILVPDPRDRDPFIVSPIPDPPEPEWIEALEAAAPVLRERIAGDDATRAAWAAFVLAQVEPLAPGLLEALRAGLRDDDPQLRQRSALALSWIGHAAESATGDLIRALGDDAAAAFAAAALPAVGAPAARAVPALLAALRDESRPVLRREAAFALAEYEDRAGAAVPILAAALHGTTVLWEGGTRRKVTHPGVAWPAIVLARFGPAARAAVTDLLRAVSYGGSIPPSLDASSAAKLALSRIGTPAESAFRTLLEEPSHRTWAAIRLARMGPPHVEPLRRLLAASPSDATLAEVARSIRSEDAALVDLVAGGLASENAKLRMSVALALLRVGTRTEEALAVVIAAIDANWRTWPARFFLEDVGTVAPRLVPALARAVERGGENAGLAATCLERIGPAAAPAVPALTRAVDRFDLDAAQALGRIGPMARSALPALRTFHRSRGDHFREQARIAIRKITRD